MHRLRRVLIPSLATALGLALTAAGSLSAQASGGPSGTRFSLASQSAFSGYDAVTAADGTAYVGWIGNTYSTPDLRQVHLCVLPIGARSCSGGVQTVDALDDSTAQNLHVVDVAGTVELVWVAQGGDTSGDYSGSFGVATVTAGILGAPTAVAGAPTYGTLTSVIVTKSGAVSAAAIGDSTNDVNVYYYPTLSSTPTVLTRPYFVGTAQLADNGSKTVLTTSLYGSLSGKVSVASKASSGSTWTKFTTVAHSYTGGNIEQLRTVGARIWMVGMSDKSLYEPFVWRWGGSSFGNPTSTGDHKYISGVDLTSDSSGRLASVMPEDGQLAVANFGTGKRSPLFRLTPPSKDTLAGGGAQLTTSASGRGWVIYGVQSSGTVGDALYAQPIKLPALTTTVHARSKAGELVLTGPASCLPITTVHVTLSGKPAKHWKVASKSLRLGAKKVGSTINGASLAASHRYSLKGTVVFKNGGRHSTLTKTLSFTTCRRP